MTYRGEGGELTPLRLDVGVATDERILVERLQRGIGGRQPAEAVEVRSVDAVDEADRRGSPGKGVCTGGRLVLSSCACPLVTSCGRWFVLPELAQI